MTTLRTQRPSFPHVVTLVVGLGMGWFLAGPRASTPLLASAGDRSGNSVLTTGSTFIEYNESTKIQIAHDALYYLDYQRGKLYATIPTMRQSVGSSTILGAFSERDLVADFKLDLDTVSAPRFLMVTGSVPSGSTNKYGEGWAPLFVIEERTRQAAVYKIQQQTISNSASVRLDLVELKPLGNKPIAAR